MARLLWQPTEQRIKQTNMFRFMRMINENYQKNFSEYDDRRKWSIDHFPEFWKAMWDFVDIVASQKAQAVVDDLGKMPGAKWFPGARLNYAENLLCYRDDPDENKYHTAYFDVYPNLWRHGDYIVITERGGIITFGRSDATLNPGGVRIGTAEIYRQIDLIDDIADSVVVGQDWNNDVRVILFVKMTDGVELTEALIQKIKTTIRTNASPRHVPAKIIPVADIPYTLNMKKVEIAVMKVIQNQAVTDKGALINPEALDCYAHMKELQEN